MSKDFQLFQGRAVSGEGTSQQFRNGISALTTWLGDAELVRMRRMEDGRLEVVLRVDADAVWPTPGGGSSARRAGEGSMGSGGNNFGLKACSEGFQKFSADKKAARRRSPVRAKKAPRNLPRGGGSGGRSQSGPYPARAAKVMESPAHNTGTNGGRAQQSGRVLPREDFPRPKKAAGEERKGI